MLSRSFISFIFLMIFSSLSFAESRPVLRYDFENRAWGYTKSGCLLNEDREVYKWVDHSPEPPRKVREMTREELQEVRGLLLEAEQGEISEPRHRRADYGKIVYKGYIYEDADRTREVFLGQDGDWVIENSSPAAKTLMDILEEICSQ